MVTSFPLNAYSTKVVNVNMVVVVGSGRSCLVIIWKAFINYNNWNWDSLPSSIFDER